MTPAHRRSERSLPSTAAFSSTWTRAAQTRKSSTWTRRATVAVASTLSALVAFAPGVATAATEAAPAAPTNQYVVRALPGTLGSVHADLLRRGTVVRQLKLINADVARLTAAQAATLAGDPRVASITPDAVVRLNTTTASPTGPVQSLLNVAQDVGATKMWKKLVTGRGIDVALIDSGVTPVPALDNGQIAFGPDLSLDSQNPDKRYVDGYGHGTHMAGIIAGLDLQDGVSGIAPGSRVVSVKVADSRGNSDVSQVIAGIGWVVEHAKTDGRNIRVLNLSFGTDSTQAYAMDPLAFAAEQAWHAGIVVVVSGGNAGQTRPGLTNPAIDPFVLAVGAADLTGTAPTVAGFSSRGVNGRNPDVLAPGARIASLRVPGSTLDDQRPAARLSATKFVGSGTSQAAAVVSGEAALLLQARPNLTPDQVKGLLTGTATSIAGASASAQGKGLANVATAFASTATPAAQTFDRSAGTGSLEASRGSAHLGEGAGALVGEVDVMGRPVDTAELARKTADRAAWVGGSFNGTRWTGDGLASSTWASSTWASSTWASSTWASSTWASSTWASSTWASSTWASSTWASSTWASSTWAASLWG